MSYLTRTICIKFNVLIITFQLLYIHEIIKNKLTNISHTWKIIISKCRYVNRQTALVKILCYVKVILVFYLVKFNNLGWIYAMYI